MSTPEDAVLGFVRNAADRRRRAEREFRAAIATARGIGLPIPLIAQAAELSPSRAHAILQEEALLATNSRPSERRSDVEPDVVVVAAGRAAAAEYAIYDAYVCQVGRAFRDVDRIGFYRTRRVEPFFPLIRYRLDDVEFSHHRAEELRASGAPLERDVADVIDRMLADGRRRAGEMYQVFLLTTQDDPNTIVLASPINHTLIGRGSAWTQGQRYISTASLLEGPRSTEDLY